MNNKSLVIVNVVLGVLILILFYLQFSKSNQPKPSSKEVSNDNNTEMPIDTIQKNGNSNLSIAYVNSDTLTKYYEFSKKLSKELMGKQASAEAKLKAMYKQYQQKVEKFQKEAPIMGQEELERNQMEIYQMEQEIAMKEQELSNNLADKNYKANVDYVLTTDKYLQSVGKKLGYDFIIGYRTGDLIMYANPKYDITSEVIELLNETYSNDSTRNN